MKFQGDRTVALLILLPSLILVGVFVYGFIGQTVYVSLTDWGQGAALAENPEMNLIGLKNYGELFSGFLNSRFRQDLVNAVFYTVFLVSGALGIGLILAILLDRGPKGESVFRTIFLYPMSLSFIVTGTIWRWLLAPRGGINKLPEMVGLPGIGFRWLNSRQSVLNFNWQDLPQITAIVVAVIFFYIVFQQWTKGRKKKGLLSLIPAGALLLWAFWGAKFTPEILPVPESHGFNLATIGVIITAIWQYSGYTMALYLAGLRGISEDLREAARLDGANQFQYYLNVAIPILKPMTMSAIIILAHISLKMFALIFAMTGPDNAQTSHPAVLMYLTTFRANNFAKGAAIAVVLFAMVAVFIVPYLISAYRERRA
ncbi:sugar ABC transporter permease [Candidatus Bipolaricaulota bacterium]|nr:sugar ABC transporter permease [Candidatus Bipolaricaulota bacterium]